MKSLFTILIISTYFVVTATAQQQTNQSGGRGIASSMGIYVFPSKGQTTDQQDQDESACYRWAIQQSGYDPMNPPDIQAAPVDRGPDGTMVRSSAGGAAMGAAIGAIAGDAGKGAAIGAVAGGFRGLRARRMGHAMEEQQAQQSVQQQQSSLNERFKKAFSVCMEGKGYSVK
jgi:hypothetical protein